MTALPHHAVAPAAIAWPMRRFFVGVDLGQAQDPTAISIIERASLPADGDVTTIVAGPRRLIHAFNLRHVERVTLRTSYVEQAAHVMRIMATAPVRGNSRLVIDATGVGKAVLEIFQRSGLRPLPLTITSGDGARRDADGWRVSKLALTSRLQAMLHSGELRIAKGVREADILRGELADFRVSHTDAGNATFSARAGRHDDLVLSLAIAAFIAVEETRTTTTITEFRL